MMKMPSRPTIHEANWLFTFLVIGWGGAIGSATSVLLVGAFAWNLALLAIGQLNIAVEREARVTAIAFAAFFGALMLSNIINQPPGRVGAELLKTLPFLGLFLFYASLTHSTRNLIAHAVRNGAITGAYAAFAIVVVQYVYFDEARPAGAAGNPGPLAAIAGFLYCLCLLTAVKRTGLECLLAMGAVACAAVMLLLTGMRGVWPVLVVGLIIPYAVYGRSVLNGRAWQALAIGSVLLVVAAAISYESVSQRIANIAEDSHRITALGDFDNSIGHRLVIWEAGLDLVRERPFLGHGADIRQLMHERTQELGGVEASYSHFHNFVINTLVRGGILGLAALLAMMLVPLWMAARRRRDDIADFGFGMMLSLYSTFVVSGMTNIMLHHDIMDTLFIFGTAVSCFLVFRNDDGLRHGCGERAK